MTEIKPRYLIMVTSANNNKYYRQIPHGNTWTAEYGRVGAAPQKAEYPMSKWDSKYKEKIRKGYIDQSDLVEDLLQAENPKAQSPYREIENKAIAEIVEHLQEMARQAISDNYSISSNKVTQAMVDKAQDIINGLINVESTDVFNEQLLKLFTTIPRAMGEVLCYLASSKTEFTEIIKREQDLLDVMKGQVVQKKIDDDAKAILQSETNQSQLTILETLGLQFSECDEQDIEVIKEHLGESKNRFRRAWRVNNLNTRRRFDEFVIAENITDKKLLWHGSRNENWWSIINTGLVLRPTNVFISGKMFGYGCYFAPKAQKSIGYTSGGRESFMALMEVAYGKPYDVYTFDSKYYDYDYEHLQKECPGANCLHAHAGSMLRNDEIVIYREEQISIKYLVEIS